jgi:hypothetical protein
MIRKSLPKFFLLAVLSTVVAACGKTETSQRRTAATATTGTSQVASREEKYDTDKDTDLDHPDADEHGKRSLPDTDNDDDSVGKGRHDPDDRGVLAFGRPARGSDRAQIVALVRRYYVAAAANDGTKACSMLYSPYAEAVPQDYGTSPPGPVYAQGSTCATVLTLLFKHFHQEVAARLPKLKISVVRTKERQGVAVLNFGSPSEREIRVSREGHNWKVLALLDNELP